MVGEQVRDEPDQIWAAILLYDGESGGPNRVGAARVEARSDLGGRCRGLPGPAPPVADLPGRCEVTPSALV